VEKIEVWEVGSGGDKETSLLTAIDATKTEDELEEILTRSPEMLERGLQLVGRQTPMTGGGYLDLLAVDGDGRLVVFELKRGSLSRDAVAQVIDYASDLKTMGLNELAKLVVDQSGNRGIPKMDDFVDWYDRHYGGQSIESLRPPRMVLVGLGVDDATERMVSFLVDSGVEISLVTFQGFEYNARTLLARHVEVDSMREKPPSSSPYSLFEKRSQSPNTQELLQVVTAMFMRQHSGFWHSHSSSRRNFVLDFSWYAMPEESKSKPRATLFLEIDENTDGVKVGYHPIAVHLASKSAFDELKNQGFVFETKYASNAPHIGPITDEFKFSLPSVEAWNEHEDQLTALTLKVCAAYNAAREEATTEQ
jgi:hypothetical protein